MTSPAEPQTLPWDWYPGTIPPNVQIDPSAYIETTFSFLLYRSTQETGLRIGRGASTYLGTMFDVGQNGVVTLGDFALVHGARIICDSAVEIGHHALISWNVVLMDNYRAPTDRAARREVLRQGNIEHAIHDVAPPRPIKIGANVWIGFDACVMPGVTVGDGAIIGARSVVFEDVPAYSVAVGNPARIVRRLEPEGGQS